MLIHQRAFDQLAPGSGSTSAAPGTLAPGAADDPFLSGRATDAAGSWGLGAVWVAGVAGGLAAGWFQSRRQMSRWTGMSLGMSRRPGMKGRSSSRMVAAPVR